MLLCFLEYQNITQHCIPHDVPLHVLDSSDTCVVYHVGKLGAKVSKSGPTRAFFHIYAPALLFNAHYSNVQG